MTSARKTSEKIKVGINLNLKSLKVDERRLKQNSFKLSFESRGVRDFSNVMWETVPCRRSCIGKAASLAEFDACPWSLIFAGTGRAHGLYMTTI